MAAQRSSDRGGPVRRVTRVLVRAALAIAGLMVLAIILYRFVPPVSTLMLARWVTGASATRDWVPLADISPSLPRAVIASEDSRFCLHNGVDWGALQDVIEDADEDGPSRGASTIAMQTVKNTLLWPGRSYIRKGLEIPLALITDLVWSKRRVMEIYLNVAEWGEGTFGAEAAARRYFGKPARTLSPREAALLAAVLPNPILRNAGRPSGFVARRAAAIVRRMHHEDVACLAPDG
jgi:monofunctional biosynthetic peptidoglycan transglycosylase